MSLIVNQNLSAMNAHHYLKNTQNAFGRSVEKLSSGLRINRAADDPAGLVISEKFRAQVDGLKQAIRNAKDGISLIQTAEGALDEVATILRSMRNLALHSANTGGTDAAAAAANQAQINDAIATLDRIANTTSFGNTKLLNGQSGVAATVTNPDAIAFVSGTTATQSDTYAINVTQAAVRGTHISEAGRTVSEAMGTLAGTAGAQDFAAVNATFTVGINDGTNSVDITQPFVTITLDTDNVTKDSLVSQLNAGFAAESLDMTAYVSGNRIAIKGNSLDDGMQIVVDARAAGGAGQTNLQNLTGFTSSALLTTESATASTGVIANASAKLGVSETLTFQATATSVPVSVNLTAGMTIQRAIDSINSALQSNSIRATASYDSATGMLTIQNNEYGGVDTAKVRISSSLDLDAATGKQGTGLSTGVNDIKYVASGDRGTEGRDVEGEFNGVAGTGIGLLLTGPVGLPSEGLTLRVAGGFDGDAGTVTVVQGSLTFQIGAFANETVTVQLQDLRSTGLGIHATGTTYMDTTAISVANIDVTAGGGKGAQDAILVLDAAITQVSLMRAEMGAFQKDTLEASVRNLGIAAQNMASSESTIRDADMAEEMLAFSRAQILQQTSMAMLAQANQSPQMIMRLFQ
jgi:flagellin